MGRKGETKRIKMIVREWNTGWFTASSNCNKSLFALLTLFIRREYPSRTAICSIPDSFHLASIYKYKSNTHKRLSKVQFEGKAIWSYTEECWWLRNDPSTARMMGQKSVRYPWRPVMKRSPALRAHATVARDC